MLIQRIHKLAQEKFGNIKADPTYQKKEYYFNKDIVAKSVTLYRDIQQPLVLFAFVIPVYNQRKIVCLSLLQLFLVREKDHVYIKS